jgi:formiminoglutamase
MLETDLQKYVDSVWTGRKDGTHKDVLRWHQIVQKLNLDDKQIKPFPGSICFSGYACDTGAVKNSGRPGAVNGPLKLRQACASFPVHHQFSIYETGDVRVIDGDLLSTQQLIGSRVAEILGKGLFPVIIGGDHSLAYGHYTGLRSFLDRTTPGKSLGIINFDAHFDLRPVDSAGQGHSGSSFYQIGIECRQQDLPFHYLPIGIQKISNTVKLYQTAKSFGVDFITGEQFQSDQLVDKHILEFIDQVDYIYLSICLDVFSAAFAPGVSAPANRGIVPDYILYRSLRKIVKSRKLISMDIAELNPVFDEQDKTAKLGAAILFEVVDNLFD